MKTLLIGINAQYIHTALAVRSIAACARRDGCPALSFLEFTINQPLDYILEQIVSWQPDVLLFSCYIWNWEYVAHLVPDLRLVLPRVKIFLGGPQVAFCAEETLRYLPQADGVLLGEGETSVPQLLHILERHNFLERPLEEDVSLDGVPSLCYRKHGGLVFTPPTPPAAMETLAMCYPDLADLHNQIIYYESSRGCPFQCTYCLSGISRGVRLKPARQVCAELDAFLQAGVKQVKFCDRTFNCNAEHCEWIWKYLIANDNGRTNFHFEIAAELLTDAQLSLLRAARPGLFQFEIGVQSANPDTLKAVCRPADWEKLRHCCEKLRHAGNIHLHLDLIAGLPFEGYGSFSRSFDAVYTLEPDQLQLGFLKCLPGSKLYEQREAFGIVCRCAPPYEVLYTRWISCQELFSLKKVEQMVESFHNSGAFRHTLRYLLTLSQSPFSLYQRLGEQYQARGYFSAPPSRTALYDFLAQSCPEADPEILYALLLLDICCCGKPKKLPDCLQSHHQKADYHRIRAFYDAPENRTRYLPGYADMDSATLRRVTHLEIFPIDVLGKAYSKKETALLFDYAQKPCRISLVPMD